MPLDEGNAEGSSALLRDCMCEELPINSDFILSAFHSARRSASDAGKIIVKHYVIQKSARFMQGRFRKTTERFAFVENAKFGIAMP